MRWFWQRRRQRQATADIVETPSSAPTFTAPVQRAPTTSGRLGQPRQISSELLLLARDYLQAAGGRVRVEDEDVLSATQLDGSLVRYTTTLAKARADESMTLLVEGSAALGAILGAIASRSRLTALRLAPGADPVTLAMETCVTPTAKCGHCLNSSNLSDMAAMALCDTCPLRERRIVLRWRSQGRLSARMVRHEQSRSIELVYLMVARDHQGRRDEWMRHAVDTATGHSIPVLAESAFTSAQSDGPPAGYERELTAACASAERLLGDPLAAIGIFLRQRSLDEYRRRHEEVVTTFERLTSESPEAGRAAKAGRSRALSALSDVYAVDVEAQLESACFIDSPYAVVALSPTKADGELLLRVDMGRQYVIPPDCATCGASLHAGYVCDAGHAVCARCAAACARCGAWRCASCGEEALATCANCGQMTDISNTSGHAAEAIPADGAFGVEHLQALPPEVWLTAIEWLLARQGIAVESRRIVGELTLWQGHSSTGKTLIAALRSGGQWALDERAVRQAVAHMAMEQTALNRMLLTTDVATDAARRTSEQMGAQLVDRHALQSLLSGLASAHDRERERQLDETQSRADAAVATRQGMLDVIDAVEQALSPLRRARKAGAQPTIGAAASRALVEARTAIERASLVWETLLADWTESFGQRAARNGSLLIQAESGRFEEMNSRSAHLRTALVDAISMLGSTPARGEAGYTAWRQAVVDECMARCEAWRWRIRTFDPSAWSDFARAWNTKASEKAAEAMTAAGHATARADKAQAQAARAG